MMGANYNVCLLEAAGELQHRLSIMYEGNTDAVTLPPCVSSHSAGVVGPSPHLPIRQMPSNLYFLALDP